MNKSIWEQKIPTLFGLLAIVIGIFATTSLAKNTAIFKNFASPSEDPHGVRITNISDTSFTISYTTSASVIGTILYGKDKNNPQTAFDSRDGQNSSAPHTIHYITVKNLSPSTTYFFSIVSGQTTYSQGEQPFQVTTLSQQPGSSSATFKGSLLLPDGTNPKEAVVYLQPNATSNVTSSFTQDGNFTISLDPQISSPPAQLSLLTSGDSYTSNVTISGDQSVIPPITLSNNYDFTTSQSPISSGSASFAGFPTIAATTSAATAPEILSPTKNEQFTDQQPEFQGKAVPGSSIQLSIQSQNEISAELTADEGGNWSYRPPTPLAAGEHTISITTADSFGILRTISQSFTVYASGSQVSEPATPSATPTSLPTPIPTAIPTIIPSITVPVSGDSSAINVIVIGSTIAVVGSLLFFMSRGKITL